MSVDELIGPVLDEGFLAGDPFPRLARLREEAPVALDPRDRLRAGPTP